MSANETNYTISKSAEFGLGYQKGYTEGFEDGKNQSTLDTEALEAQAAENAYHEMWDAFLTFVNMGSDNRRKHFGQPTIAEACAMMDYKDLMIGVRAYKEEKGILEREHMKVLRCFLRTYGKQALEAAIKRIQEDKE